VNLNTEALKYLIFGEASHPTIFAGGRVFLKEISRVSGQNSRISEKHQST
jgi:hypothetical protein